MKVKPQGKTDVSGVNHDEMLVHVQKPMQGLKVKTGIKAGRFFDQPPVPGSGASSFR